MDADAASITDLTSGLVRVLDDDGIARRPYDPSLSADAMRADLRATSAPSLKVRSSSRNAMWR
ncbi:hypothetical protein MesoLj113c_63120 [Mesorhizobium sp. 113-3-9]|nr:hypothetical protein MesoLj113c_63120 [Mesorhizobium sp. 113-3-9]